MDRERVRVAHLSDPTGDEAGRNCRSDARPDYVCGDE